jgi:hypothetical protein
MLLLLLYFLPLTLIVLFFIFLDHAIITVRDLFSCWWAYLVPVFNIFILLVVIFDIIFDIIMKINISVRVKEKFNNFLNKEFNYKL